MSGLTQSGFEKETLDQIKTRIENSLDALIGVVDKDPEGPFGQVIGVISEIASDLWDLAELVYYSQYPNSAVGIALDNSIQYNNLKRLAATKSSVICIVEGDEGTTVPIETQFRQPSTSLLFKTTEEIVITKTDILKSRVSINMEDDAPYTITIVHPSGTGVYTSNLTLTADILADLRDKINAETYAVASIDSVEEQLILVSYDNETSFEIQLTTSNLDLDEIWTPVNTVAIIEGSISVPANTITQVETPVSGLNSVDNLLVGTTGRNDETDDELRVRRVQSLRVVGAATVPAIEARILQDIDDVTAVSVKDNREDVVVDGRPPHSIEVIATYPEGDAEVEQAIADKIWEVGGGGIQTHGTIMKTIVDSSGDIHPIYFSRPEDRYVHINIEITLYDEEVFPVDGIDSIKQAIVEYGNTLKADADVIPQRFFAAIYSVEGVGTIPLYEHDDTTNPGDTPTYTTNILEMADNQIARFNTDRISVTIV